MAIEIVQGAVLTGTPVTTATLMINRVPTGTKNSSNKVFTMLETPVAGSIQWKLRDSILEETNATDGFTRSGLTVTLGTNVTAPAATDHQVYFCLKA